MDIGLIIKLVLALSLWILGYRLGWCDFILPERWKRIHRPPDDTEEIDGNSKAKGTAETGPAPGR